MNGFLIGDAITGACLLSVPLKPAMGIRGLGGGGASASSNSRSEDGGGGNEKVSAGATAAFVFAFLHRAMEASKAKGAMTRKKRTKRNENGNGGNVDFSDPQQHFSYLPSAPPPLAPSSSSSATPQRQQQQECSPSSSRRVEWWREVCDVKALPPDFYDTLTRVTESDRRQQLNSGNPKTKAPLTRQEVRTSVALAETTRVPPPRPVELAVDGGGGGDDTASSSSAHYYVGDIEYSNFPPNASPITMFTQTNPSVACEVDEEVGEEEEEEEVTMYFYLHPALPLFCVAVDTVKQSCSDREWDDDDDTDEDDDGGGGHRNGQQVTANNGNYSIKMRSRRAPVPMGAYVAAAMANLFIRHYGAIFLKSLVKGGGGGGGMGGGGSDFASPISTRRAGATPPPPPVLRSPINNSIGDGGGGWNGGGSSGSAAIKSSDLKAIKKGMLPMMKSVYRRAVSGVISSTLETHLEQLIGGAADLNDRSSGSVRKKVNPPITERFQLVIEPETAGSVRPPNAPPASRDAGNPLRTLVDVFNKQKNRQQKGENGNGGDGSASVSCRPKHPVALLTSSMILIHYGPPADDVSGSTFMASNSKAAEEERRRMKKKEAEEEAARKAAKKLKQSSPTAEDPPSTKTAKVKKVLPPVMGLYFMSLVDASPSLQLSSPPPQNAAKKREATASAANNNNNNTAAPPPPPPPLPAFRVSVAMPSNPLAALAWAGAEARRMRQTLTIGIRVDKKMGVGSGGGGGGMIATDQRNLRFILNNLTTRQCDKHHRCDGASPATVVSSSACVVVPVGSHQMSAGGAGVGARGNGILTVDGIALTEKVSAFFTGVAFPKVMRSQQGDIVGPWAVGGGSATSVGTAMLRIGASGTTASGVYSAQPLAIELMDEEKVLDYIATRSTAKQKEKNAERNGAAAGPSSFSSLSSPSAALRTSVPHPSVQNTIIMGNDPSRVTQIKQPFMLLPPETYIHRHACAIAVSPLLTVSLRLTFRAIVAAEEDNDDRDDDENENSYSGVQSSSSLLPSRRVAIAFINTVCDSLQEAIAHSIGPKTVAGSGIKARGGALSSSSADGVGGLVSVWAPLLKILYENDIQLM